MPLGLRGSNSRPIGLLGAPVEAGAGSRGMVMGPAALRTAGLLGALARLGHEVADLGDCVPAVINGESTSDGDGVGLAWDSHVRNPDEVAGWARALDARAHAIIDAGATPLFLGGDHSLSMGTVNGVARYCRDQGRPLFVLWLDAHADFNTPATSPTGNLHGMPAAHLCGEPGLGWVLGNRERLVIAPDCMLLFGIRSIDPDERRLLRQRGIGVADMRKIDEFGVSTLLRRFLDTVCARDGRVHVSLDVDFLDPSVAPGVATPVPGGASYREAHLIMELLAESGRVVSADVAELNPFLDDRGRTACILVELIASLFGQTVFDHPAEPRWTV